MEDVRAELQHLWEEHLAEPFPRAAWADVEKRFGAAPNDADVASFALYDADVAGTVSTVLGGSRSGAAGLDDGLGSMTEDTRIARYLKLCEEKASDDASSASVKACREYLDRLNRMLALARRVPKR